MITSSPLPIKFSSPFLEDKITYPKKHKGKSELHDQQLVIFFSFYMENWIYALAPNNFSHIS